MESDSAEEALEKIFRILGSTVSSLHQGIAHRQQVAFRRQNAEERARAQFEQEQWQAQLKTARQLWAQMRRDDWWAQATPAAVARGYLLARTYEQIDQQAQHMVGEIEQRVQQEKGWSIQELLENQSATSWDKTLLGQVQQQMMTPDQYAQWQAIKGPLAQLWPGFADVVEFLDQRVEAAQEFAKAEAERAADKTQTVQTNTELEEVEVEQSGQELQDTKNQQEVGQESEQENFPEQAKEDAGKSVDARALVDEVLPWKQHRVPDRRVEEIAGLIQARLDAGWTKQTLGSVLDQRKLPDTISSYAGLVASRLNSLEGVQPPAPLAAPVTPLALAEAGKNPEGNYLQWQVQQALAKASEAPEANRGNLWWAERFGAAPSKVALTENLSEWAATQVQEHGWTMPDTASTGSETTPEDSSIETDKTGVQTVEETAEEETLEAVEAS